MDPWPGDEAGGCVSQAVVKFCSRRNGVVIRVIIDQDMTVFAGRDEFLFPLEGRELCDRENSRLSRPIDERGFDLSLIHI